MPAVKTAADPPDAKLLLPRRYQEEIFRQSRDGNVIAALDTGSGKTFISTLLIKWMSLQEHAQGKAIIFLVPKVTLVEQQGDFIAAQTPLRVRKLRGSIEMDLTDRAKWKEAFKSADVLVMTGKYIILDRAVFMPLLVYIVAQIFTNILTHSHWSIEKVGRAMDLHYSLTRVITGIVNRFRRMPSLSQESCLQCHYAGIPTNTTTV